MDENIAKLLGDLYAERNRATELYVALYRVVEDWDRGHVKDFDNIILRAKATLRANAVDRLSDAERLVLNVND